MHNIKRAIGSIKQPLPPQPILNQYSLILEPHPNHTTQDKGRITSLWTVSTHSVLVNITKA